MEFRLRFIGPDGRSYDSFQDVFPEAEAPRLFVSGLPISPRWLELVLAGEVKPETPPFFEIPDDHPAIALFRVEFPRTSQAVSVAARFLRALGAEVQRIGPTAVQIEIQHGDMKGRAIHKHGNAAEQCTVTCPRTGESHSGPGVCINCTDGKHTVRICC